MADDGMGGPETAFGIGAPMRRREDRRFLTGRGRYVDDIRLDGQCVAVFLRSPYAHALITNVDASEAKRAPGVLGAFTHIDASAFGLAHMQPMARPTEADGATVAAVDAPHLARDRVRYVGQPVAMVVAETMAAARDALEAIAVDYVELPSVVDPRAALEADAPQLHDEARDNTAYAWRAGDPAAVERAFDAARRGGGATVSVRVDNPRLAATSLEPRAINAAYDAEAGRWTLYVGSQGAHSMRGRIAQQLGVEPERIRVITPDVGGGFGMKLMVHVEYALVAAAARRLGRPVRWTSDRSEALISDVQGRGLSTDAEAAFDAEGKLLAARARSISDLGAYPSQAGMAIHSIFSANLLGTIYRLPAAAVEVRGAYVNAAPTDAYRGAGRPETNHIMERLMTAGAEALGLTPGQIRQRNLLGPDDAPFETPFGGRIVSADAPRLLGAALEAADLLGAETRKAEARARGRTLGVGVACYAERTGGGPNEAARIRVRGDGRISATVGTQSSGQGHETSWTQIVHARLGVDPEAIDTPSGDSDLLPVGGGTGGARSLIQAHRTLYLAADHLVAQGRDVAARLLEASVADIEFRAEGGLKFSRPAGGVFAVAGTDRSVSLFDVAAAADGGALTGEGQVGDRTATYPNGAHVAEVELDPETGKIEVTRYLAVDDFGRILNPLLVGGQVHGGVIQGLGQALFERSVYDAETGQPLTGSFMDYAAPRADDAPPMRVTLDEGAPEPTNPMGVKGCGESGTVGALPTIVLAVRDALAAHGVRDLEPPFAPVRVWEAIRAASAF